MKTEGLEYDWANKPASKSAQIQITNQLKVSLKSTQNQLKISSKSAYKSVDKSAYKSNQLTYQHIIIS